MARIGILGGTFDPPHNGHLALAEAALKELALDKVIFIPARVPPHKMKHRISSEKDRMAMLRLTVDARPHFEISDIEFSRPGPSYTVDTLQEMVEKGPNDKLFYMIGADNVSEMESWYNPEKILGLATVAAANRPHFEPKGKYAGRVLVFHMPPVEISSSMIRERAKSGRPVQGLVPPEVDAYIVRNNLYKSDG